MQPPAHTSKDFDAELQRIRAMVGEMGNMAGEQIRFAMDALQQGDAGLVDRVLEGEVKINRFERQIDEACTNVIARRAPAAGDLRFLITIYKTITDLERVGDEAKKIALAAHGLRFH